MCLVSVYVDHHYSNKLFLKENEQLKRCSNDKCTMNKNYILLVYAKMTATVQKVDFHLYFPAFNFNNRFLLLFRIVNMSKANVSCLCICAHKFYNNTIYALNTVFAL